MSNCFNTPTKISNLAIEKELVGKKYWLAPILSSRIDCRLSFANFCAAEIAIQNSTKSIYDPSIYELIILTEGLRNSFTLLYNTVIPNLLGCETIYDIRKSHPQVLEDLIIVKNFTDKILVTLTGSSLCPISITKNPAKLNRLKDYLKDISSVYQACQNCLNVLSVFNLPVIDLSAETISLPKRINSAEIWKGEGRIIDLDEYQKNFLEQIKFNPKRRELTIHGQEVYSGTLAKEFLRGKIVNKNISDEINIKSKRLTIDLKNIEELINQILTKHREVIIKVPVQESRGLSIIESNFGIVLHDYQINKEGYISQCKIIIPTDFNGPILEKILKSNVKILSLVENLALKNFLTEIMI